MRYIELLPPEKRPVAGTEGAAYRRQQMARQLPEHDQDPTRCHELSPAEVKQMEQFVRRYKDEALGVGDVALPEEMALARAKGGFGPGTGEATVGAGSGSGPGAAAAGPLAGAGGGAGFGAGAPAGRGVGAGGAGPLSGPGTGPHAAGAAGTGTAGAAGGVVVPGAQQARLPQRDFVRTICFLIIIFVLTRIYVLFKGYYFSIFFMGFIWGGYIYIYIFQCFFFLRIFIFLRYIHFFYRIFIFEGIFIHSLFK